MQSNDMILTYIHFQWDSLLHPICLYIHRIHYISDVYKYTHESSCRQPVSLHYIDTQLFIDRVVVNIRNSLQLMSFLYLVG